MHVAGFIVHDSSAHVVLFFDQNVMTFSISETACFPADVMNPSYFSAPILVRNAHFSQSNQLKSCPTMFLFEDPVWLENLRLPK